MCVKHCDGPVTLPSSSPSIHKLVSLFQNPVSASELKQRKGKDRLQVGALCDRIAAASSPSLDPLVYTLQNIRTSTDILRRIFIS